MGVLSTYNVAFILCIIGVVHGFAPRPQLSNPHIVGGEEIDIEKVPYMVSIRRFLNYYCGASIIGKYYALSAAHCFYERYWIIWYGVNSGSDLRKQGTYRFIRSITPHEKFNIENSDYDVCVVRIWFGFDFNEANVIPIALPDVGEKIAVGTPLVVTGWGRTSAFSESLPDKLRAVEVVYMDQKECKDLYSRHNVTDRMFCAGYRNGGKDACNGDSGGPIVDMASGIQVGVVSWGIGCGEPKNPGVYSALSHPEIAEFIQKNIK